MAGKCRGLGAVAVRLEVEQVVLDHTRPHHIDADDIDVRRLGREQLAQQRQVVGRTGGRGVQPDRVAVFAAQSRAYFSQKARSAAFEPQEIVNAADWAVRDDSSSKPPAKRFVSLVFIGIQKSTVRAPNRCAVRRSVGRLIGARDDAANRASAWERPLRRAEPDAYRMYRSCGNGSFRCNRQSLPNIRCARFRRSTLSLQSGSKRFSRC